MKRITKKWRKWFAIPLAIVLVLSIVVPWQVSREPEPVFASGVDATSVTLTAQVAGSHTFVQFNIGWDNSWRDVVNWDAVWVFIKYKVDAGDWNHAALSTTSGDHTAPTGSTITATTDGTGVFIYRDSVGSGTVSFTGVQLKWNYFGQGVANDALVTVKVFAIEMVYIPQASFYVGDYDADQINNFYEGGTTDPYQITSEGAITVANTAGNLYYNAIADSYPGDRSGPIPAAFPKGYDAFYMMKYEISQGQYAEFLNTLTSTQATARFPAGKFYVNRNFLKLVGGVYGADGTINNIFNEPGDGDGVAMNWMGWADSVAYADWAGLRPMTELEFAKAARGTLAVFDDEYVWGTTTIIQQTNAADWGYDTEYPTPTNSNANYGNSAIPQGPMRVGSFSDSDDTREEAGASYYGVMELNGNLWERPVTVGDTTGRAFTGLHGDGTLTTAGDADVTSWPGTDAVGAGFRGGSWAMPDGRIRLSDRWFAAFSQSEISSDYGFRAVRTAP